ncbi:MAG TPA: SAM-dependent methyltransferase [Rhizobium sp.]|nr:SAM-dependent methyltransferase [Rhizobium sp.]
MWASARIASLRKAPEEQEGFSQYEMRLPHHQNAIDALPGWNSSFPSELNLAAGAIPLFADGRIFKALDTYGSIEGKRILEVGPLEGMHTYILNQRNPASIDAIEANKQCFMRCLVTKEILRLDRANIYLGDIKNWLEASDTVYDFALASGVLYHMPDPGEFLRLLAGRTQALFLWTHYYDETLMPESDVRHTPFSGNVKTRDIGGQQIRYFERSYQFANMSASFCGGMNDRHYWMHRNDILKLLNHLGYNDVVVQDEEPLHSGGPCFSVFARRAPIAND